MRTHKRTLAAFPCVRAGGAGAGGSVAGVPLPRRGGRGEASQRAGEVLLQPPALRLLLPALRPHVPHAGGAQSHAGGTAAELARARQLGGSCCSWLCQRVSVGCPATRALPAPSLLPAGPPVPRLRQGAAGGGAVHLLRPPGGPQLCSGRGNLVPEPALQTAPAAAPSIERLLPLPAVGDLVRLARALLQVFVRAMHSTKTMEDFEVSVYNTM